MTATLLAGASYAQRRRRAQELAQRWPFAAEVLGFYAALLEVQESANATARSETPGPEETAAYAGRNVLPRIVEVAAAKGPPLLQQGVLERFDSIGVEATCRAWLRGEELDPIDRFLARGATAPVLEALGARASEACEGERDERHCPVCAGQPQLGYFAVSDDDLVTPHRYLECSRCSTSWAFARMTCASCGETESDRLPIFSERGSLEGEMTGRTIKKAELDAVPDESLRAATTPQFPHVRIDGCLSCSRYLLTIDAGRDRHVVPVVDELAAIPLSLYAESRGLRKVVANQMGF
jgi:formate dehydrogenase maturation protein FdhE